MTNARQILHRGTIAPGLITAAGLIFLVFALLVQIFRSSEQNQTFFGSISERDWWIVGFTSFQASLSVLLSLSVGFSLAWALYHQRQFHGRSILIALFSSALVLPTLVVVLGIVSVLGRRGWLNDFANLLTGNDFGSFIYGLTGILIAHVYLNASFSVRTMLNRLESIPAEKRKLAKSLDLSAWQRFLLVEWPAVRPVVPRLATVIFLLCFTSFAIVLTLGGSPKYNTLEVAIFEAVKLEFDLARALDLALLQLLICAALVLASSRFSGADTLIAPDDFGQAWKEPTSNTTIQILIITTFSIFFLSPLLAVIVDGLQADLGRIISERAFKQSLTTSLVLASLSSLLTLSCALAISSAYRNFVLSHRMGKAEYSGLVAKLLTFSGTLYLAVPSLVMALGFFLIARQLPGSLTFWGFLAILAANTLMALPFAIAILLPAMEKLALRYDKLVFSLDLARISRWRFLEWPVLRKDIGYVCAVSFCLSFGDLGVVALFGSQDFSTLPWYLYQKMGAYRTDDAAGVALIMLAITITIFFAVPKLIAGNKSETGNRYA